MVNPTLPEKLTIAKYLLLSESPFFSYLVMMLQMKEEKNIPTAGIEHNGTLHYNPDWLNQFTPKQIQFVLLHEIMHKIQLNFERKGSKKQYLWNIATDLVNNQILLQSGFQHPILNNKPEGLIPIKGEYYIESLNHTIKDIDKRTAEDVYAELEKLKDQNNSLPDLNKSRWDNHDCWGESITEEEIKERENKCKKLIAEASSVGNMAGKMPAGLQRLIDDLLQSKVHWKDYLYKYITNSIINDYTYRKIHKKSYGLGIYLPSIHKEECEVVVIIDTSGSVDDDILKGFLSELIGIAKSFNNVKMRVICADYEVQGDYEVANGNIQKILDLEFKGNGGTSFINPLNYTLNNYPSTKLVVYLTDGEGDKVESGQYPFSIIWALKEGGTQKYIKESGEIVEVS